MKVSVALLAVLGLLSLTEATILITGVTGTVAAGTAASTAALAGIGGLALGAGLIGALALATRGRGGGRRFRGKRSTDEIVKEDSVFNLVAASDSFGCAMKLVCLLEAKPEEQLTEDDKFILTIFGREPEAPTIDEMKTSRGAYDYAAFMGNKFGNEACEQLFHTCTYSYEQMIAYVAQLRA